MKISNRLRGIAFSACALALCGCIGISPEARSLLQEPQSCEQVSQIQMLGEQKSGAFFRLTQGFQGIAPPMVVLSLLRDVVGKPFRSVYLDHWRVAFGSYNRQIDERVGALEQCGGAGAAAEPGAMEESEPMEAPSDNP